MAGKATYFLSDLHLGARYLGDEHEAERRVCRFLDSIKDDAARIYLVGDILDYWYEYRYAVPKGYVRFFGKIAELADAGVEITWFIGNHDIWIFDYLPKELGIRVLDGSLLEVIDGKRFFITHGDGVGKRPWSFRVLRSIFRNRVAQKLYSGIHPRWTIPFALNWSKSSRKTHGGDNNAVEHLRAFSESAEAPEADFYVYGHLHLVVEETLKRGAKMVVLGDWITNFSYARYADGAMQIARYEG